jgi:peroxin-19
MDKDLDDLLDSALDDFANKPTPLTNAATSPPQPQLIASSNITIEKTNLYVDDIDYEDRPVTQTSKVSSTTQAKATSHGPSSATSSNAFDFKLSDDEMKMFDEIFNDSKTKETMQQFNEAMNMFKTGGDEAKLMENFQKVMSQLNDFDLGDEDDDDDEEEGDDQTKAGHDAKVDPLKGVDFDFLKNLTAGLTPSPGATSASSNSPKSSTQDKKSSLNATAADSNTESEKKRSTLDKVLEDMNKNSERVLKSDKFPFGSDLLSKLLNTTQEDTDELDSESSLMLEPLLNMLFSKEILYPSLKMMSENYDKYLIEQKEKLNDTEYAKCVSQKECIREMCLIYESSSETDTSEEKTEKLKKILDLLEKCGVIFFLI